MQPHRKSWPATLKEAAGIGLGLNIVTLPIALGILAGGPRWYLAFLTIPAAILLCLVIASIARVISTIRGPAALTPRPPRPAQVIAKRAAAIIGLLVAAGAGIALMAVGVKFASDAPACDPEVSDCVLVVDGVARGESHDSVGDQQFSNILVGGVAFVPGLGLLVASYFGAERLTRSIRAARAAG